MIITRTPFRISFVGGGSDLEAFYAHDQGAVLSTSINKYMYISSHKYFDKDKIRVKYSRTETVDTVAELEHPILKTVFQKFNMAGGVEVSSIADIPSGTGMGSSSSFTVGLLHNLYTRSRQFVSKETLAAEACHVEIDLLKEPIGKQDQYAAAYGGLNVIKFNKRGTVDVEPLFLNKDVYAELESNLMLFYYGNQRKASEILSEQKKNTSAADKLKALKEMVGLVFELRDTLYSGNLERFGDLLDHNWQLKRSLASQVSNPEIDEIYALAMKSGALGGKLLGAGGGGFFLFYCPKEKQNQLKEGLKKLSLFDFKFDSGGSKLIYVEDE